MNNYINAIKFAELFKKYRLRSEIQTLAEFGNLLAEEGLMYEDSLFTRWQKGERVPKDRRVLLAIIRIFVKRGGIRVKEEINDFLASVNQRDLSEDEYILYSQQLQESISTNSETTGSYISSDKKSFSNKWKLFIKNIIPTSGIGIVLFTLYLLILSWWIRINIYQIRANDEVYLYEAIYALLALLGSINGFLISRKYGGWSNYLGRSLFFFSLGLLGLWFGQTMWSYYNIIARIELPYPSIADIGFVSIIPFYILGSIYLAKSSGLFFKIKSAKELFIIVLTPIVLFIVTHILFLQHIVFDFTHPIRLFLSLMYSLGEATVISLAIIIFILSASANQKQKKIIQYIIFALGFQYITDSTFLYIASNGYYYNGGIIDLLLSTSFFIMSIALVKISNILDSDFNKNISRSSNLLHQEGSSYHHQPIKTNNVFLKRYAYISIIFVICSIVVIIRNNHI